MKNLMSYAASSRNPPKGYGSIEAGMQALAYRSERLKWWKTTLKVDVYTDQCFINAEADVIAKFGQPF